MKLLEKVKVPIDVILIVVGPFVGFLILFLYLAGLIPAQPIIVEIPDNAAVRQMGDDAGEASAQAVTAEATRVGAFEPVAPTVKPEPRDVGEESEALLETVEQVPSRAAATKPLVVENPIDEERAKRVKQIAKVYDQMNAGSVAAIVKSMRDKDAVEILSMMNPRNAARVLAALDPDKAARLSLMLAD
jgi:hypothetical protein